MTSLQMFSHLSVSFHFQKAQELAGQQVSTVQYMYFQAPDCKSKFPIRDLILALFRAQYFQSKVSRLSPFSPTIPSVLLDIRWLYRVSVYAWSLGRQAVSTTTAVNGEGQHVVVFAVRWSYGWVIIKVEYNESFGRLPQCFCWLQMRSHCVFLVAVSSLT